MRLRRHHSLGAVDAIPEGKHPVIQSVLHGLRFQSSGLKASALHTKTIRHDLDFGRKRRDYFLVG